MKLTQQLKDFLRGQGAALAGVGDLRGAADCSYPVGAVVALPLPPNVIRDLQTAPTEEYYHLYHSMNQKLNKIVLAGEQFLKDQGYRAWAQTTDRITLSPDHVSPLPHKTIAVRAGLGWIGKNCLLVTPEYGPALRLSSLLTDAPLVCGQPIVQSQCGGCDLCVRHCPARALKGRLWQVGDRREALVDVDLCIQKQREIMRRAVGLDIDLCGKCFAVCAYTQNYLQNAAQPAEAACLQSSGR